jgi:hypothetical protein
MTVFDYTCGAMTAAASAENVSLDTADVVRDVSKTRGIPEASSNRIALSNAAGLHVPLRRRQILMTRQLLNRSRRCAAHRQMRTERVPQSMHTVLRNLRPPRRAFDVMLHDVRRHRRSIRLTQHAFRSQVPMLSKRCASTAPSREFKAQDRRAHVCRFLLGL